MTEPDPSAVPGAGRRTSGRLAGIALALALLLPAAASATPARLSLIPWPAEVRTAPAGFHLASGQQISVPAQDAAARFAADQLAARLARRPALRLTVAEAGPAAIRFVRDPAIAGDEAYRIEIGPDGVVLRARGDSGLYYAAMTLWQVATPAATAEGADLPGLIISDAPRFRWRGLLLDSARHYQSPAFIRRLIDAESSLKLNVLQWHLTDDQAWRLEVPAWPRLVRVGGCRREAGFGRRRRVCGVYTEAEVRALVAYAAQRRVRIVPEIDVPGHASAAVAAYPELGAAPVAAAPRPRAPENRWGVFKTVYAPSERTVAMLDAVYDEVAALFPDPFVHIGGDEVIRQQWAASPAVQARMKALGVPTEAGLQGWFAAHAAARLARHGRRAIGWDEILDGGAPPDAAIMSWRGVAGAEAASAAGHDVVLSPAPVLYLDNRQDDLGTEPPGRGHVTALAEVYAFDPAPPALTDAQRAHVLGVQANLWTEHLRTEARVERAAFPRAAALAEVAWSPAPRRPLPDFEGRLLDQFDRFDADGVIHSETWFQPRATVRRIDAGHVSLGLSRPASLGEVRYSLDGAPVGPASPVADGPLTLTLPARLQAASFVDGRRVSPEVRLELSAASLSRIDNHGLALCSDQLSLNLEGEPERRGGRGFLVDILHPCWIWRGADLDQVRALTARVVPLPFNFALGADDPDNPRLNLQHLAAPRTRHGELVARLDGCDGPVIASLPLRARRRGQVLRGRVTPGVGGVHDVCLSFTGTRPEPL